MKLLVLLIYGTAIKHYPLHATHREPYRILMNFSHPTVSLLQSQSVLQAANVVIRFQLLMNSPLDYVYGTQTKDTFVRLARHDNKRKTNYRYAIE